VARERKGSIYAGPKGELHVKFTIDVLDEAGKKTGKTRREAYNLHTYDGRLANLKRMTLMKELQEKGTLPKADAKALIKASPLFREAAEAVLNSSIIKTIKGQKQRLAKYAYPVIGHLRVDQIKTSRMFVMCLEKCRGMGKSKQTGIHLKNDLSKVWRLLVEDDKVPVELSMIALAARLPDGFKEDGRERTVLTDEELMVYLQWTHVSAKRHVHVLERQTKCCLARLLGGARTSEVHRLQWTSFEMMDGEFVTCRLRRSKKKGPPQRLEIPTMLRPVLAHWWELAGKPETGFVFGKVKGAIGEQRSKTSLADAFRRDLARAFDLEKYDPKEKNYVPDPEVKWTRRQIELLKGTDEFLPVDFHSWRRSFCKAVDATDISESEKDDLSNHAPGGVRKLYLRNGGKALVFPEAALPARPLLPAGIVIDTVATEAAQPIVPENDDSSELSAIVAKYGSDDAHKRRMGRLFRPTHSIGS